VFTNPDFQGCVDLGGSIITGLEGNPITTVVKQLGVKLHVLGAACPIFNHEGKPVDEQIDAKVEEMFNSFLDQAAHFKIDSSKVDRYTTLEKKLCYM
jgi:hypothetical protein